MFNLCTIGLWAQEDTDETALVVAAEAVDPITAAEQALPVGGEAVAVPPAASTLGIFRVLLTLAVVAAAIYGIVFFIKRVSRGGREQDPFLKVLASTPLGTNRSAHILSVGQRAWLVGAAENGVHLISEIEDKEVLDTMLLADSRRSAEGSTNGPAGRFDFKSLLRKLGMPSETDTPSSPESIRKRGERLKGL